MKTLPVAIFTHNRTKVACATVDALLDHLKCPGWEIRYILCDDRSRPGHVDSVVKAFEDRGVTPSVHLNDERRHGLGASMNKGLEDAFSTSPVCLRMEDDWLLKRDLDLSKWAANMDRLSIGSLRLGMMFRDRDELVPYELGLLKLRSRKSRRMTFNNQVALVTEAVYEACGRAYPENAPPNVVEATMADAYNAATNKCDTSPWVCWPAGWNTMSYYGPAMAFDHIGVSTSGHGYRIPEKYMHLQEGVRAPASAVSSRPARGVSTADRSVR